MPPTNTPRNAVQPGLSTRGLHYYATQHQDHASSQLRLRCRKQAAYNNPRQHTSTTTTPPACLHKICLPHRHPNDKRHAKSQTLPDPGPLGILVPPSSAGVALPKTALSNLQPCTNHRYLYLHAFVQNLYASTALHSSSTVTQRWQLFFEQLMPSSGKPRTSPQMSFVSPCMFRPRSSQALTFVFFSPTADRDPPKL